MENYIDDATLTPLFDTCPIMRKALAFLESIIPLLVQISSLTPLEFIRSFWNDFRGLLCPMTEGGFLANFLHLGSVVLKTVGSDALFLVQDLLNVLPSALENINEQCRGESCRCLGWLCQVFPEVVVGCECDVGDGEVLGVHRERDAGGDEEETGRCRVTCRCECRADSPWIWPPAR